MTSRQAWFCPACQRHHAPHCDTCPAGSLQGGTDLHKPGFFDPHPFQYWRTDQSYDPCAACKGKACGNAACPKLPQVTCANTIVVSDITPQSIASLKAAAERSVRSAARLS